MQLVKIGRRPSRKRQVLDNVASVAKIWSEWQLAQRAGKGVAKGAKTAGKVVVVYRVAPVKTMAVVAGAAAGVGALIAYKRRGGGEELWSPPPAADAAPVPPPPAARAAAPEGANGVTTISGPPAAAPEAAPVDEESAAVARFAEADQPETKDDATKVSEKPADD